MIQPARSISDSLCREFLAELLAGRRSRCAAILTEQLDAGANPTDLYEDLIGPAMVEVGRLWERNQISVAAEHLATSITEGLLNLVYPRLISSHRVGRTALLACIERELHQVGLKMVADHFEKFGWDALFIGANTPTQELVRGVREHGAELLGLSVSIYFNLGALERVIEAVRRELPDLRIVVGGRAFLFEANGEVEVRGTQVLDRFDGVVYIRDLHEFERFLEAEQA